MKKILSTLIITAMLLSSMLTAYADNSMSDIQNHWGEAYIKELVSMKAINGYPDGTFKPENNISYAEYLSILVRTTKAGNGDYSTSGNDEWYSGVIKAAQQSGILSAYEIKDFNAPINRADAAMYTEKAIRLVLGEEEIKLEGAERLVGDYSSFKDTEQSYFIVQQYARGILAGKDSKGTFDANSNLSRAEAATIILRTVKTENRKTITQADIPAEEVTTNNSIAYETGKNAGIMRIEHSREYGKKAFSTAKFYKENGEYYASITLPELPEGYFWTVSVNSKLANGNDYFGSTSNAKKGLVRGLEVNGSTYTFRFYDVFEEGIGPEQIDTVTMSISVCSKSLEDAGKRSSLEYQMISNKSPNKMLEEQVSNSISNWVDFDTSNIFNW